MAQSTKPPTTADHEPYSKRAMARDCVALMRALGHERFAVVGHDRGAYVALADWRSTIRRRSPALAVLDGVPIGEALARCDARFAARWWHWFFLGQTDKPAERVINADPTPGTGRPERDGRRGVRGLRPAIHDPATVHAMCEDYRAGLGVDRAADEADRAAGRRIALPGAVRLVERDDMEELYGDPLAIWRSGPRRARRADRPRPPHGRGGAGRARRRVAGLRQWSVKERQVTGGLYLPGHVVGERVGMRSGIAREAGLELRIAAKCQRRKA